MQLFSARQEKGFKSDVCGIDMGKFGLVKLDYIVPQRFVRVVRKKLDRQG